MSNAGGGNDPAVSNKVNASMDLSSLITFNPTALEIALSTMITRIDVLEKDAQNRPQQQSAAAPAEGTTSEAQPNATSSEAKPRGSQASAPSTPTQQPVTTTTEEKQAASAAMPTSTSPQPMASTSGVSSPTSPDIPANLSRRLARLEDTSKAHDEALEDVKKKMDGVTEKANDLGKRADSTDNVIADHSKRLDALEELAKELSKKQDALANDIANCENGVDGIRGDLGKAQGRIGTLEGLTALLNSDKDGKDVGAEIKSFSETLGDLKAEQAALKAQMNEVQQATEAAQGTLSDLDKEKAPVGEISALKGDLQKLAEQVAGLDDQVKAEASKPRSPVVTERSSPTVTAAAAPEVTKDDLAQLQDRVDDLARRQDALAATQADSSNKTKSPTPPQPAIQSPITTGGAAKADAKAVADLEKRVGALENWRPTVDRDVKRLENGLNGIKDTVESHKAQLKTLGNESSRLSEENSKRTSEIKKLDEVKADRSEIDGVKNEARDNKNSMASAKTQLGNMAGTLSDLQRQHGELKDLYAKLNGVTTSLGNEKAGKDMMGHISVDVAELSSRLDALAANHPATAVNSGASDEQVKKLQAAINECIVNAAQDKEWSQAQLVEIKATVEHIHHSKADASLVANKAERDYVENAMEKLMREVEQVLNNTNSGLIDTIDKSLNILRDMIDGKATKEDVNSLKKGITAGENGADATGQVPDGLMGYKGYRCLGCNRTMEGMRSRPMGSSFSAFLNRVPASPRVPKPPGITAASPTTPSASPAGYLTAPPGSA